MVTDTAAAYETVLKNSKKLVLEFTKILIYLQKRALYHLKYYHRQHFGFGYRFLKPSILAVSMIIDTFLFLI